ncbi:MAG: hypothetical protein QOF44_1741 [Streptomyces sp.]|nr:hypothetical protein [Streptomyces sp.]
MFIAKVTTFWNACIAVLVKCVAALGVTVSSKATIPALALAPTPATEATEPARDRLATIPSPRSFEPLRDRSLPPTMKQRIRAEAHGSSPATRSLPADPADSPAPTLAA